jgi:hypothetical protein
MSDVTRLRISTVDPENVQMGSGEVVSARVTEGGSSAEGYSESDLQGVTPYANMQEFVDATRSKEYQGGVFNSREAEAYRELCAKRLAKMEQRQSQQERSAASTLSVAEQLVQLDATIPLPIAQLAAEAGPFLTREDRARHYSDPKYGTSADFRALVGARDALTDSF